MFKKILHKQIQIRQYQLSLWKVGLYLGLSVWSILCVCVFVLLLFPQLYTNDFLKYCLTTELKITYPTSTVKIERVDFHLWENRLDIENFSLKAQDASSSFSIDSTSIIGIRWAQIFRAESLTKHMLNNSVIYAKHISINSGSYTYRCKQLDISVPDSSVTVKSVQVHPLKSDEQFFENSKFRSTRYNLAFSQCMFSGVDMPGLLQGKSYHVRSTYAEDVMLDILLNRDKAYDYNSSKPLMPNELLLSIHESLQIGSLNIIRGHLKYAERLVVGAKPGVLTFENVQMSVVGITNRAKRGASIAIRAQGNFMNSGLMKVRMSIPALSSHLNLHYSGSLGAMDLTKLNPFLEIAEHTRIKSGSIQEAAYEIDVDAGHATGNLRVVYKDLYIVILNKKTGSANGVFDQVKTFIANLIKFRGNNIPDKSGNMKIGSANYARKPDEAFTQFVWFGLRSAVGDVAGF